MNFVAALAHAERANRSLLCVGLDPDPARFPGAMKGDASRIFEFCAAIVDRTRDLVIAFKPQIAYFAAHGAEAQLERLIAYIHETAPAVPAAERDRLLALTPRAYVGLAATLAQSAAADAAAAAAPTVATKARP